MNKKIFYIVALLLVALVQAYVPISMIMQRETVLKDGKLYKFRCRPVDPNDPFRGKFVALRFEEENYAFTKKDHWEAGMKMYAVLDEDRNGYAVVKTLSQNIPHNSAYMEVEVISHWSNQFQLRFPFDRYYMEESKALNAELVYAQEAKDAVAYVWVKDGTTVLNKVMIGKETLEEAAVRYEAQKNIHKIEQ